MADEKLNVSPEENPQPSLFDTGPADAPAPETPAPEPPAPENTPEQAAVDAPAQDAPAGAPGEVSVSVDQIEKLMAEQRAAGRAEVEKNEPPEPEQPPTPAPEDKAAEDKGPAKKGKAATFSENSRSSYQRNLDVHILPVLGDFLMVDITPAMISKLLLDFQKSGHAHASAVKLYNILNGIFQMAFLDDTIKENPMLKVKRPAPRKEEMARDETEKACTVQQLAYILQCLENEPLKWQTYINLVADTGIRRGEACALEWADIDWAKGTITIRRNLRSQSCKRR